MSDKTISAESVPTISPVVDSPVVDRLDRVGVWASALCALHCALLPLAVILLPLLGFGFLASEPLEWALLGVSAFFGITSVCLGFREHRAPGVGVLVAVALALLVAARVWAHGGHAGHAHHGAHGHEFSWLETSLMVAGGLTMIGAHWINARLCRSCRRCSHH